MCLFSFLFVWGEVPKGGGYMALELFFVSARTNKRHHHILTPYRHCYCTYHLYWWNQPLNPSRHPSISPPTHPPTHPSVCPGDESCTYGRLTGIKNTHRKKPRSKAWQQDLSQKNHYIKTEGFINPRVADSVKPVALGFSNFKPNSSALLSVLLYIHIHTYTYL